MANDKEAYGQGLATLLELQKAYYGVTIVSNTGIDPTAPNFRSYASTIKSQGADCFEFAGIVSNGGVQITKDVAAAIPTARSSAGRYVHEHLDQPDGGRRAGGDRPADRVHGRDAGPDRLSGRQGVPGRLQGRVRLATPTRTRSTATRR